MSKRLLEYTPKKLASLSKQEFLDGIRTSEARTVGAYVCPFAANYVEKVSNVELMASFGADYITLEGYDPLNIQIPGLPSKNIENDKMTKELLQVELGKGWTIKEIKELVGRPIGAILLVPKDDQETFGGVYSKSIYSDELMSKMVEEGYDFVCLCGYGQERLIAAVKEVSEKFSDRIVIEAGIPHGPGYIDGEFPSYNLKDVVTVDFVKSLAHAGADIVDIPAVGVVPGYTIEYVSSLVEAIHSENRLAASSIAHSLEASSTTVLERLVIDNKICGVDMFNIAAGGVYESVTLPEAMMDVCIAVKGKRHTYRRMAQSPIR